MERNTLQIIRPIILEVYGDRKFPRALAAHLAERLEGGLRYSDEREATIRNICWDWMTGGSTAAYVAGRIEAALKEAGL